jgi:hypothetical protein
MPKVADEEGHALKAIAVIVGYVIYPAKECADKSNE